MPQFHNLPIRTFMGRFAHIKHYIVKIEQILVLHLFNTKQLTLQGIGSFTLDPSIAAPQENEKEIVLPQNAISFTYNPKATEDDALINTIVQNSKKIKPLASADLDSYLILGRQFLNIGKPFTIEGLGTLDKTQAGALEFIPGQFITPKITPPKALKENEGEVISGLFQDHERARETDRGKKALITLVVILVVALGGWAIWHFAFRRSTPSKPVIETIQQVPVTDSSVVKKDSIVASPPVSAHPGSEGYTFKIVFKTTTNKDAAWKAREKMRNYGHKVIMYTSDSINYKVAEPFRLPLSDTTRIKDSLNKYYYLGKARVEL